MKTILIKRKKSGVAAAAISLIIGAVLLMRPESSILWMCTAIGALILGAGVINLVSYFKGTGILSFFHLNLIIGVVLSIMGLWMVLKPESVVSAVQYVFGAIILVRALIDLQAAISLSRAGGNAKFAFIACAITLVFGLLILLDPFKSLALLVRIIGAVLVFNGVNDLYLIFSLSNIDAAVAADCGPIEAEFVEAPRDDDSLGQ